MKLIEYIVYSHLQDKQDNKKTGVYKEYIHAKDEDEVKEKVHAKHGRNNNITKIEN